MRRLLVRVGGKDQAIVLVGGQGLLEPPLGTEHQPAPLDVGQLVLPGDQFDDLQGEQIVERREAIAKRIGADPLGDQTPDQRADFASQVDQRRQVACRQDCL
jgi:hypothetical protein